MSEPDAGEVVLVFARATEAEGPEGCAMPEGATLFLSTRGEPDALVVSERGATVEALECALSPRFLVTNVARCRSVGALPRASERRPTRGLLVGAADCGDDARANEFHDFYDRVHAREVLDTGLYWRGRRFERIAGHRSLPQFFALYDAASDEPETYRDLRTRPMTKRWPDVFLVRGVWTFNAATR